MYIGANMDLFMLLSQFIKLGPLGGGGRGIFEDILFLPMAYSLFLEKFMRTIY